MNLIMRIVISDSIFDGLKPMQQQRLNTNAYYYFWQFIT